jgi:MoaA/NifB/PqqE/SkfB family radical SAM enzyme
LSLNEIGQVATSLSDLGTRLVVFSGGEPLLRSDVFDAAAMFRARGIGLHLLTSGVLLDRHADRVAQWFSRVCISLDATTEALYERIRGIAALETVTDGVSRLRRLAPDLPITARATLHRANYRELPRLVERARAMGLDGISFLPADLSSHAFGRETMPDGTALALTRDDVTAFEQTVERTIAAFGDEFACGFIAESPDKLRRLPRYYAALSGDGPFPEVHCNAPWVSIVIEANGAVRPCFFHDVIGNVRDTPLPEIVSDHLREFRRSLVLESDPICVRCVCSLKTGWRHAPWA